MISGNFDILRSARLLNDNPNIIKDAHNILNKDILYRLECNYNLINQPDINKIAINKLNESNKLNYYKILCKYRKSKRKDWS